MSQLIRLNGIVEESIVDGPGLRYVLFTQGCPHRCKGCHNPHTHAVDGGYELDTQSIMEQFQENPLLCGITFSGGEPFMQPAPLREIATRVKDLGKSVMTYTGYAFERLLDLSLHNRHISALLDLTDILVDGPYQEDLRDLTLDFRGSANQRLLSQADRQRLAAERAMRERATGRLGVLVPSFGLSIR